MNRALKVFAVAIAVLLLAACGGAGGSGDDDKDEGDPEPPPIVSAFAGTWLSQDASHAIKAVVDSAGCPSIYMSDGLGNYDLTESYTSPLVYNAASQVISLADDAHFYGLTKWSGSFNEDGDAWAKSGTLWDGTTIYACTGGSTATGIGTWTCLIDECNSDFSRAYRKLSFSFAAGIGASSFSGEGQHIDVGETVPPPLETYSGTCSISGWTLNADGTGLFTLDDSTEPGLPDGDYPFFSIGDTIVFGIANPGAPAPATQATLNKVKTLYLVKQ
jgi:hypothetical protein